MLLRATAVLDIADNRHPHPVSPASGSRRNFRMCSRIVNASSSACVGCSWRPSPALMMCESWRAARICGKRPPRCAATQSHPSASPRYSCQRVVQRLPFTEEDELAAIESVSVVSRFAASSNDVRVRVLGS